MHELPYTLMAELERVKSEGHAPVHLWHPDVVKDIDLVIRKDGTWDYMGSPIKRPRLVRLFASVLRRDDDGYCLVTPVEKCRITVEDVPFQGVLLEVDGTDKHQVLKITTDMGEQVVIDDEHPLRIEVQGEEWIPYVLIRDGMEARLNRNVYYQLTELTATAADPESGRERIGVYSCGTFFALMDA